MIVRGSLQIGAFEVPQADAHDAQALMRLRHISTEFDAAVLENRIAPLLQHGKPTSLRVLDWLVVNYSKKQPVGYLLRNMHSGSRFFNLHHSYMTWLHTFRRRLFDPFRRGAHVHFATASGVRVSTTPAQLNFLYWALTHEVLDYMVRNHTLVERDMNQTLTLARVARQNGMRAKRAKLVPRDARARGVCFAISNGSVRMVFDQTYNADANADADATAEVDLKAEVGAEATCCAV